KGKEAMLPFLFRGEAAWLQGGIRFEYDFLRRNEIDDFRLEGVARFDPQEGRIVPEGIGDGGGVLWGPGRWTSFQSSALLDLPSVGGIRLFFRPVGGPATVVDVRRESEKSWADIRKLMPDGRYWKKATLPLKISDSSGLEIKWGFEKGHLWARIGKEKEIRAKVREKGAGEVGFGPLGIFSLCSFQIEGNLDPAWAEELQVLENYRTEFVKGRPLEFIGKVPLSRWGRRGGKAQERGGVVLLEAEDDSTWVWLPEGRDLLSKEASFTVYIEVRRRTDRGYFFATFTAQDKDIAWQLIPERDETPPAGASDDFPVLSMVPFSDGQWHKILIEVKEDMTSMYVDGGIREVFSTSDLGAMGTGTVKPKGLGFGVQGGSWEVRSFRLRRLR
ncbi:MAG: hypothetical protein ACYTFG_11465, partial [Planctomycetota bacterium]